MARYMRPPIYLLQIIIFSTFYHAYGDKFDTLVNEYETGIQNLKTLSEPYAKIQEPETFERELYNKIDVSQKYDFIVIGAGAAGATVAYRLAEITQWKILLIEAGDAEDEITRIPSVSFNLLSSKYNWGYFTSPQKNWCFGSPNNKCLLGMGKALGGSTAINGMLWARGNPKDYDTWAQKGNEGWSYNDVLPYFKKVEDAAGIKKFSTHHQGKGGKVHLENTHFKSNGTEYVLRAAHELKIPYVNYNSDKQLGIGHAQGTLKGGSRWSSARAYLGNVTKIPNLTIKTRSTVLKVLIDETTKKAYGVQYIHNETIYEVNATKEVILSAGGMSTPKLLMLSGVGPTKDLEDLGIQPLSNLQVGSTLLTHPAFFGLKAIFSNSALPPEDTRRDLVEYLKKEKGPLTAFSSDLVAYFDTGLTNASKDYPDIEITFAPRRQRSSGEDKLAVSFSVVLMRPKSMGSLKLTSSDPLIPPLIDPNYLSDKEDEDFRTILAGIRLGQELASSNIFKKHGGYLARTPTPACASLEYDSNAYWRCSVQHNTICLSDPASTAKMGPTSDREAVVDSKLRVYGIQNLRVVDNSVIPVYVTGHMMAPAYMIGEKAADIIKFFWKNK